MQKMLAVTFALGAALIQLVHAAFAARLVGNNNQPLLRYLSVWSRAGMGG